MLTTLTCAAPPSLSSSSLPPSTNQINRVRLLRQNNRYGVTIHHVKRLKANLAGRPTLLLFNMCLQLYVGAGLMNEAQSLFDEMPERTLISWTILISGYTRHGPAVETLMIFQNMIQDASYTLLKPDSFVFATVLRACAAAKNLIYGRQVHCRILKTDGIMDSFVENALVTMYASCGSLQDSSLAFSCILWPNLVSWSSMLSGYTQNGLDEEGLSLFCDMIRAGIQPDAFALSMAIGACAKLSCLDFGMQVHCFIIKIDFASSLFMHNSLIDFYASCGNMDLSRQVFDNMPTRDLVSWNTIISGYVHNTHNHEVLNLFQTLMHELSNCDEFTLASMLQAITGLESSNFGREIHGYILRAGFESDLYLISSLLNMYTECFDLNGLDDMDGIVPRIFKVHIKQGGLDEFIIASILKWCSLQSDHRIGQMFHSHIIKLDLKADPYVISSLIDMYSKCGMILAAQRVFVRLKDPGTVTWSAIIAGYRWNGYFQEALKLFREMQLTGAKANEYTYTSVLLACLDLMDVKIGKELHCKILRTGYGSNVSVVNTLIKLYSEVWHHQQALKLCTLIPVDVSWGFLIQACFRAKDHESIHKILLSIQRTQGDLDPTYACQVLSSCANPVLLNVGTQAQAYLMKRGLISDSDTRTSNSLITMYSGCGEIAASVTAFSQMHEKNSVSWTSIISAKVDHGHPLEALDLFTQMRWKNKSPDSTTFICVLKACAQKGLVDKAFHFFILMDEIYGIEPSVEHYCCMVEVLGRAGMYEEALEFIDGVIPFKPRPLVWRTLLSSCRINGNMKVAKYAIEKLLEVEPGDFAANLLLEQVLLTLGKWKDALKAKTKNNFIRDNSSWIEVRNTIYGFASDQIPMKEVCTELADLEEKMETLGYVADRNHLLHNSEEGECGAGIYHSEIKALAFGLISLPHGMSIRVVKSVRMCGDCHSACKFMSTFIGRNLVIRDPCNFHHFKDGKCSCKDMW
ncbi:pentatricopeptide repeat-containing protein At5g04780, mitochondrial-like [Telopea speciosissima]|uniref:pentatricopeptide repeat-containing protein At5g04780, mitochondrial-like n=1 Tax=Telopea speciosissima TaxID=54955 RepID=UPI001CC6DB4E|nr:pentatricopeptide repeat-containing protein At5g04780, mitochondrial-like [Telopea speciosissima]